MTVMWFKDDEAGFADWCATHARGFVVNAHYKPAPGYLVLHKVGCSTFKGRGGFTGPEYSKFCSASIDGLLAMVHMEANAQAFSSICSTCHPLTTG
jgi:hypothetical protein